MKNNISKSKVNEYYANVVEEYFYDRENEYGFDVQKKIILRMLETLDGNGKKIIDIGCGSGLLTEQFLSRGYEVWGIDMSEEMISSAKLIRYERNINKEKVHYDLGDIEDLDFTDDFFDVIVTIGVFGSLSTYELALKEIYRVLKPDGVAIIALGTKLSPYNILLRFSEKTIIWVYHRFKTLITNKTLSEKFERNLCFPWKFDKQAEDIGFNKDESEYCYFIFYPLYPLFNKFSIYISRKLERFSKSKYLCWLGSQYIVKLTKD